MDPKQDRSRALFRLALDFYRQPLRLRGWVNAARPLPAGVGDLLESVAADSASLERRAASLGVTPEELREAGRFFIRQVWLVEGADPYRTLGLAAGASLDQVRDHYRKLIRLYHPDRAGPLGEWDTTYAARINRAYRLLRDPGKRPDRVVRTQPAADQGPKRRTSPGRSSAKAPSRQWPRRAILRWLFKTFRGEPGAHPQRRPASRLFQRLGLGLSLAAVTASALFIAHHLLVLYASLAAEGLRPIPPVDVADPGGLTASREAAGPCVAPSLSQADCRALSSETQPEQAVLLEALDALPIRPAAITPEKGALGLTGASRSVWTPYLPQAPGILAGRHAALGSPSLYRYPRLTHPYRDASE